MLSDSICAECGSERAPQRFAFLNLLSSDRVTALEIFLNHQHVSVWLILNGRVALGSAQAMAGKHKGFQALIRKEATEAMWTHCIIHKEVLASQELCPVRNSMSTNCFQRPGFKLH